MLGEDFMADSIDNVPEAIRLARTIASDLLVYNEEKIAAGLASDDLFERLAMEIDEGHKHFNSRVEAGIRSQTNFLERALVDVLVCGSKGQPAARW